MSVAKKAKKTYWKIIPRGLDRITWSDWSHWESIMYSMCWKCWSFIFVYFF